MIFGFVTVERADIIKNQVKVYLIKHIKEKITVGSRENMKAIKFGSLKC
jgi:hypothetical protein